MEFIGVAVMGIMAIGMIVLLVMILLDKENIW